jgi:uncharacterized protein YdhG (YjbR/CyaY superfamily)
MAKFTTVDEYIASFPPETRAILEKVRRTMRSAAPGTEETISYGIPTFKVDGSAVIYFAGYAKHVSVYPAPRGAAEFKAELKDYAGGKGTVQFPLSEPIPYDLIRRIVKFRMGSRAV